MKAMQRACTGLAAVVLFLGAAREGASPPAAAAAAAVAPSATPRVTRPSFGPLFVENRGQAEPAVRYRSLFASSLVTVTDEGIVLTQVERDDESRPLRGHNVRISFRSADPAAPAPLLVPGTASPTVASYFRGNDHRRWVSGAPCWESVLFRGVADGVDIEVHGRNGVLEYDVLAAPGARLDDLQVVVEDAERLQPRGDGGLTIVTPLGRIEHGALIAWQESSAGERAAVDATVNIISPDRFRLDAKGWDDQQALTIDPTLVYSTFVEGSAGDHGWAIDLDPSGAAFIAGDTSSADFPVTPGTFDVTKTPNGIDAVVFKLNASGSSLGYATFLGGVGSSDTPTGLVVDDSGSVIITGVTGALDFPTTSGSYQPLTDGSGDAYLVKLDPTGTSLIFSTFFGGSGIDNGQDIVLDSLGRIVLAGQTKSFDMPTTRTAFQPTKPSPWEVSYSGFVARFAPDGGAIDYCTYLGGTIADYPQAVGVDAGNNIYVAGRAGSGSGDPFPTTPGSFQPLPAGQSDAFVAKLTEAGALEWSTFVGGSGTDWPLDAEVDAAGHVFVTGYTHSGSSFPTTPGAFDTTFNGETDPFVFKLSPDGSALVYCTRLGGLEFDYGNAIALSSDGTCFVACDSGSSNFPVTPDAFDSVGPDPHITRLSGDGSAMLFGSYFGGTADKSEFVNAVAVNDAGRVAMTGYTLAGNFPTTPGAFDKTMNGSNGLFVVVFDFSPWTDLGGGAPGVAGVPELQLSGPLTPDSELGLDLVGGAPSTLGVLFLSFTSSPAPFLGGTLHALPFAQMILVGTDPAGELHGAAAFPGAPSGTQIWFQIGLVDGSVAVYGASLSNAVRGTVP